MAEKELDIIEAPGTVWDTGRMADISAGVGQMLLNSYPGSTGIERAAKIAVFHAEIMDLSRGQLRDASLLTKSGFMRLYFSETCTELWGEEDLIAIAYNKFGAVYKVKGECDEEGEIARVYGLTPLTFHETKPTLDIRLYPRYLQPELLQGGAQAFQESLEAFSVTVLERYGDLKADTQMQGAEAFIQGVIRDNLRRFGRTGFVRRVTHEFTFSSSLMKPGTIHVPAEPLERFLPLLQP